MSWRPRVYHAGIWVYSTMPSPEIQRTEKEKQELNCTESEANPWKTYLNLTTLSWKILIELFPKLTTIIKFYVTLQASCDAEKNFLINNNKQILINHMRKLKYVLILSIYYRIFVKWRGHQNIQRIYISVMCMCTHTKQVFQVANKTSCCFPEFCDICDICLLCFFKWFVVISVLSLSKYSLYYLIL